MHFLKGLTAEGATRNDWYLDASLAVLGVVLVQLPYLVGLLLLSQPGHPLTIGLATGTGALMSIGVIYRRHYPSVFFALTVLILLVQVVLVPYPTISWLYLLLAVYDVARWLRARISTICLVISLVAMVIGVVRWLFVGSATGPDLQTITVLAAVSAAGALVTAYSIARRQHDVTYARTRQEIAEKDAAALQIAEQAAEQRSLEAQVRTKVARELHDVVAHSVAVMVVQAEGGLALADRAPERARQALATISDTGRESLQEMRRIVRMLRSDAEDAATMASSPRVSDIPSLIEKADATFTTSGTPHGLTPIIEMTVYRIIQEALTNSLKHAGPHAEPRVRVDWLPSQVMVNVTNKLLRPPSTKDSQGTGLIGMTERVQALDGTLTVGPNRTGGFTVCARIPLQ